MDGTFKFFDRIPRWLILVTVVVTPGAWLIAPLVAWWLSRRRQTVGG